MKEQIRNKLIEIARKGENTGKISYQELSNQCNLPFDMNSIDDRNKLAHLLGEISTSEVKNGRPMLSAVVIRHDSHLSGNGFFELAFLLDLYNGSKDEQKKEIFFFKEIKDVYSYWSKH